MSLPKSETYWGERAYETLVENASEIIARFDREYRHLYINRAVTRATGLAPSAFVGKTNGEMGMPGDLVAKWDALLERVFSTGAEATTEFSYASPDGTARWFQSRAVPETGPNGEIESVVVVSSDVTEVKAAEAHRVEALVRAARESIALLRAISDTSPDVVFAKDHDGRLTFANPATLRLIGKSADEVLGRTDAEILTDKEAARLVMETDRSIMRSGQAAEIEERVPYPDGTECIWLSRKAPYRDAEGRVVGLLGISRDITERKRGEEEVRNAHHTLQRILDSITDGLAVLDRQWRYTYFSSTGAKMLQVDAAGLLGQTVWELFPDADQLLFGREYRKAVETGAPTHFEEYYPEPLNKWIECHCYPSEEGLSVYFRDITDRKRIEAEVRTLLENEKRLRGDAEAAIEAKDRLLAAVSHELRNPLTAISGWLQVIEGEVDADMRSLAARSMRAAVATQKRMVDDLLDTVRFARGTMSFVKEPFDLREIAIEIVQTMRPVATESGISLHAESGGAVPVLGDRARLTQVIANLLSNALKFTPAEGDVRVNVRTDGQRALLEVVDSGHGIAPEFLPHVFEQFSQARTHSTQGLGLGLSIVRDIVQQHGGEIRAWSDGTGKGARFTVDLPLHKPASISTTAR